jgi:hypothetical protein
MFHSLSPNFMKNIIIHGWIFPTYIDGRKLDDVRAIEADVGLSHVSQVLTSVQVNKSLGFAIFRVIHGSFFQSSLSHTG